MRYLNINKLFLLLAVLFIAACSNTQEKPAGLSVDDLGKFVYFDYDSSEIKQEAYSVLDTNAEYIIQQIAADSSYSVVIQGHCDERGTIEYNFALGNRRAEAVARYLRVKGVPTDNLRLESLGEQEPVNTASNEAAWAQNRRGVLIYSE